MRRISNSSFTVSIGNLKMVVDKASASIEDGRKSVQDAGVPNGYVDGAVSGSGDIELDAAAMAILTEAARSAGSWQDIEPLDLLFYAKGTKEEEKVEVFGALLNLKDIVDYDPSSDKKALTKISYEITSSDFVRINGVPYLAKYRTENLV